MALDKEANFTECLLSWPPAKTAPVGPSASPFAESSRRHSTKKALMGPFVSTFAECVGRHSVKVASLPSALTTALGKEGFTGSQVSFFAECHGHNTRQSDQEVLFYLFLLFHPNKQKIYIIHITLYIIRITESTHLSSTPYISQISPHKSGFTAHKSQ